MINDIIFTVMKHRLSEHRLSLLSKYENVN